MKLALILFLFIAPLTRAQALSSTECIDLWTAEAIQNSRMLYSTKVATDLIVNGVEDAIELLGQALLYQGTFSSLYQQCKETPYFVEKQRPFFDSFYQEINTAGACGLKLVNLLNQAEAANQLQEVYYQNATPQLGILVLKQMSAIVNAALDDSISFASESSECRNNVEMTELAKQFITFFVERSSDLSEALDP